MHVDREKDASDSELQLPARYGQNDCVMVIGRGNWVLHKSRAGATASANLYSLVMTCMINNIDPHAYLTYLFTHLAAARTVETSSRFCPATCSAHWLARHPTIHSC